MPLTPVDQDAWSGACCQAPMPCWYDLYPAMPPCRGLQI